MKVKRLIALAGLLILSCTHTAQAATTGYVPVTCTIAPRPFELSVKLYKNEKSDENEVPLAGGAAFGRLIRLGDKLVSGSIEGQGGVHEYIVSLTASSDNQPYYINFSGSDMMNGTHILARSALAYRPYFPALPAKGSVAAAGQWANRTGRIYTSNSMGETQEVCVALRISHLVIHGGAEPGVLYNSAAAGTYQGNLTFTLVA